MDGRAKRTDGLRAHESYTIFMESQIVREHRTLRRELCISRMIIFALLITCVGFCPVWYLQQNADSTSHQANTTVTVAKLHAGDGDPDKVQLQTPLTAFLMIAAAPRSARANLTWELFPERFCLNFSLKDNGEALVVPRGGWYRLGLQITYMNWGESTKEEQLTLAHRIQKYSDETDEPLTILTVYETVPRKSYGYKSVFSEVVHVFHQGDSVKVQSDQALLVDSTGNRMSITFLTAQLISVIDDL